MSAISLLAVAAASSEESDAVVDTPPDVSNVSAMTIEIPEIGNTA